MTSEKRKSLRTSVLIAWILITLFAPIAVYYYIIAGNIALMGGNVYAFLWALTPSHDPVFRGASFLGILFPVDDTSIFYGIHILNPLIMSWVPVYVQYPLCCTGRTLYTGKDIHKQSDLGRTVYSNPSFI